jgi:hypothetical protein
MLFRETKGNFILKMGAVYSSENFVPTYQTKTRTTSSGKRREEKVGEVVVGFF